MAQAFVLDSVAEDAGNTALDIHDGTTYSVMYDPEWPAPPKQSSYASSADSFGERLVQHRYQNREITLKLRVRGASAAALENAMTNLEHKCSKIDRENGTLRWTSPAGRTFAFDLLSATAKFEKGPAFNRSGFVDGELTFTALPGARGAEVTHSDNVETSLPVLRFTVTGIKGPLGAYARLVIDDDEGKDQWFVQWGQQQRFYDSAASADLFYESGTRTLLSGASTTADSAASGASTVQHLNLTTAYQAILSTQASGGGTHLSHIGQFEVWARIRAVASGTAKVQLEWAEGDFKRRTRNDEVTLMNTGTAYGRYSLGQVAISKVVAGTQRWEGRILAKSTVVGDDVFVDCFWLVPVGEGSGQARVTPQLEAPITYLVRDDFGFTGGLAGRTAATGGLWTGAGDTDDFQGTGTTTELGVERTSVADTSPRINYLATDYTSVTVEVDISSTTPLNTSQQGVAARIQSASPTANYVTAAYSSGVLYMLKYTAINTFTMLGSIATGAIAPYPIAFYKLRLTVDNSGRWMIWFGPNGTDLGGVPKVSGHDSALATGGSLATGRVGLYDYGIPSQANRRLYDSFFAWTPTQDVVIHASQSAEIRHDRAIREDSTGTAWSKISRYEGDYLRVNPAGLESRTTRLLVSTAVNDPDTGADSTISNVSARLYTTPLYAEIPEA